MSETIPTMPYQVRPLCRRTLSIRHFLSSHEYTYPHRSVNRLEVTSAAPARRRRKDHGRARRGWVRSTAPQPGMKLRYYPTTAQAPTLAERKVNILIGGYYFRQRAVSILIGGYHLSPLLRPHPRTNLIHLPPRPRSLPQGQTSAIVL